MLFFACIPHQARGKEKRKKVVAKLAAAINADCL
jgi:hypothetical protein